MAWKLENDSCKIKNLDCAKATCKFRGRSWTAWYTEQYDIPFGPYLFGGLPGLIVMLEDSIGDYSFKLSGIQATPNGRPIYLRNKKNLVIYTTREKAMQGVKNECGDVSKALLARSPSMARQHNGALLNTKKSVPYNPLELE
jgi:GLPGLI family protein